MKTEDKTFWLSWCIEEYAAEKNLPSADVAAMFEKLGVLYYLSDNAAILHTQGKNYILGSIEDFISTVTL